MSYRIDTIVDAGPLNTDADLLTAVIQEHGAISSASLPSPLATITNDVTHFYFKSLGNGFHSFRYDSYALGGQANVILSYNNDFIGSFPVSPQETEPLSSVVDAIKTRDNEDTVAAVGELNIPDFCTLRAERNTLNDVENTSNVQTVKTEAGTTSHQYQTTPGTTAVPIVKRVRL